MREFSAASFDDDTSFAGDVESVLQGDASTRELDRSWVQLTNQPLQHFWETGWKWSTYSSPRKYIS